MPRLARSDSGQISILVLIISLALLAGTYLVGAIAQVIAAQQRLDTKAETIALAGAQELEFNQAQACDVANEFSASNFGQNPDCRSQSGTIEIFLSEPNPNPFLSVIIPKIQARARSGIAVDK
jgi:Flp pilus assembly protein TadG